MLKQLIPFLIIFLLAACVPTRIQSASVSTASPTPQPPSRLWWRDAVFYELFVRSFYDSNGDGIGDFNGVTTKLDYLQSLGVNAIWLMPIHPSPSYHGYDVMNYYAVNPQYGTMDDFKRLLNEAHKRNIRIIIDLVLNHTSSQHPFFVNANNDPSSQYRDWYVWSDKSSGNAWYPGKAGYYFSIFSSTMPDLNYRNPAVTAQMENVVRFWLTNVGVDGFRMDAINRLIEEGGNTENTSSTHKWLKGFYQFYKSDNPNAYTVGEVFNADASLAKTYTGDQLDQTFNFELAASIINSINGGSNSAINSALTFAQQDLPDGDYGIFLTNHDQNRVMSQLYGDVQKAKLAAFLMLTSPGTPFIYYGEEIGMQGEKPDEDIRRPMQWDSTDSGGFTTGTPWEAPADDFSTVNVAAQANDPSSLLSLYRQLITIRTQHPALRGGSLTLLNTNNSALYAALRMDDSETVLVLANLQNKSITDYDLTLSNSNLQTGNAAFSPIFGAGNFASLIVGSNGSLSNFKPLLEIPPYGMYILRIDLQK
jgi:alpha-amylase